MHLLHLVPPPEFQPLFGLPSISFCFQAVRCAFAFARQLRSEVFWLELRVPVVFGVVFR